MKMRILFPYLVLYERNIWMLITSIMLSVITSLAGISLIVFSSRFISTSAIACFADIYSFNFILPASVIRTVGRYLELLVSHDITFCVLQNLRVFFFKRLIPLFPAGLSKFRYGEILNCIISDISMLDRLYLQIIMPLISVIVAISVVVLGLSLLNIQLIMILSSVILLVFLFLPSIFYCISKSTVENLTKIRGEYRQQLTDWFYGQTELIIFGANKYYRMIMKKTEFKWYEAQNRLFQFTILSQSIMQLIEGLTLVSMLWVVAYKVDVNTKTDLTIILFIFCTLAIFEALRPISNIFQYFGQVISSAHRINQILSEKPKVFFKNQTIKTQSSVALRLHQVSFSYGSQYQNVLDNISIDIPAGTHAAIFGHTGCGKSTLLKLLTRAWDPQHGEICINNTSIDNFSETTLRKIISVVPQRTHLFSSTLRDNLLMAAPKSSDKDLRNVLAKVDLHKLLEHKGLNDWLGEGGRPLSSGELRRLAIARALLHNTSLFLLDEPTAGLDKRTEIHILDVLKEATKEKTVLMVTHRTIRTEDFNLFVFMDNGKLLRKAIK